MKYYKFRDLDHNSNYENGIHYHAYGIVEKVNNTTESPSGKDLVVVYINLESNVVDRCWRTYSEVELFEVCESLYADFAETIKAVEDHHLIQSREVKTFDHHVPGYQFVPPPIELGKE